MTLRAQRSDKAIPNRCLPRRLSRLTRADNAHARATAAPPAALPHLALLFPGGDRRVTLFVPARYNTHYERVGTCNLPPQPTYRTTTAYPLPPPSPMPVLTARLLQHSTSLAARWRRCWDACLGGARLPQPPSRMDLSVAAAVTAHCGYRRENVAQTAVMGDTVGRGMVPDGRVGTRVPVCGALPPLRRYTPAIIALLLPARALFHGALQCTPLFSSLRNRRSRVTCTRYALSFCIRGCSPTFHACSGLRHACNSRSLHCAAAHSPHISIRSDQKG